jgi:signal transduction histidine kinase
MVSGTDQGRVAGELALRILQGEPVDSIPVVMESPNRYLFDYAQMARFNLKPSDLPSGSTIMNEPPSFYAINKLAVWAVLCVFASLSILIIALMVNISKRKKAEDAFHASKQNYHTLVNNLRVGVYRSSGDLWHGSYLQANPAMLSIFGFDSVDEFASVPAASLYQNPQERQVFLDEVLAKGYVKDREIAMKTKIGQPIIVSCTTTVQYDDKDGIKWLDGVMEDVTQQKNLEDQLRQAQKMEAIGTLAGGVAHDFNNILTALMGYTDIIRKMTPETDPRWQHLRHIYTSAGKAASLVKGLLAFSRKQVLSPKPLDLNHIVIDIESLLKRILGEDVELTTHLADEPLTIFADSNQMEQVLMNLATNARDAMPSGGMISIATERIDISPENLAAFELSKPGTYALLSVSDTGDGMDAVTQQKIFEPFFTTKEVGKGTGLGLSMIYGTIKQHRGEIKVYSELGKGTVFKIYLPLHTDNVDKSIPAQHEARPVRGGKETVLVAEDNAEVRGLITNALSAHGYSVLQAIDGEDALLQFNEHATNVDLVIIDVIMPKLNGRETVQKMLAQKPGLQVLYMSGYTADVIHTKGIIDRDVDFISKPLSSALLLRKVRELLDR